MKTGRLCALIAMTLLAGSASAAFIDNFDRPNSDTVGNGWNEYTAGQNMNPRISDGAVLIGGGNPNSAYASIDHTFDAATQVSADLAWYRDVWDQPCLMNLSIPGLSVSDRGWNADEGYVYVLITDSNGTEYWRGAAADGPQDYVTYTIQTNSGGYARVLANGNEIWSGAAIAAATSVNISAGRPYWEWDWFAVDNFVATDVPEPVTMALLAAGSLLLVRRKMA